MTTTIRVRAFVKALALALPVLLGGTAFAGDGAPSAEQVAAFTIKFSEKGRFLLLPHRDTRYLWWLKRHWPGAYFSAILRFVSRVLGDEKAGG